MNPWAKAAGWSYHPVYEWDFPVNDASYVPWEPMTHMFVGYMVPALDALTGEYTIIKPAGVSAYTEVQCVAALKKFADAGAARGVVVTLHIGGMGSNDNFEWTYATNADNLAAFAQYIVDIARDEAGLDGVDINWEAGTNPVVASQLIALAQAVRALWPEALITVPTGPRGADAAELAPAKAYIDAFMPMTYLPIANWGGWLLPVPLTPLYGKLNPNSVPNPYSVEYALNNWIAAGVPASQVVMGVGGYGSAWGDDVPKDGAGPNEPYCAFDADAYGEGGDMANDNTVSQEWLDNFIATGQFTEGWDDVGMCSYWGTASPTTLVSGIDAGYASDAREFSLIFYETARSIQAKQAYIKAKAMKGMMFWSLGMMENAAGAYPVLEAAKP